MRSKHRVLIKLIVVALDETDGIYDVSWNQAGMSLSEIVGLLEVLKTNLCNKIID